jgi:hypothetical protein
MKKAKTKVNHSENKPPSLLFFVSSGILFFIFSILLVSTIGFFLKLPISQYHTIAAGIISALGLYFLLKNFYGKKYYLKFIGIIAVILILITGSMMLGNLIYDLSYDGQTYHQETIIALKEGWNPFFERLTPESKPDISYQRLVNSYPKASEMIQSVLYATSGQIESAKGLNFVMMLMALGFVLALLSELKIGKYVSIIGSIPLVLNPIFIVQAFSFYIDSQIYFTLLSLGALLGLYILNPKTQFAIPIILILPIIWNMKLTAVLFSGIFLVFALIIILILKKYFSIKKTALTLGAAGILGLAFGFNPYITNIKWFGNPFYPAYGKNSVDFVPLNVPATFFNKNSFERLILSIGSKSEMQRGEEKRHDLKAPFTYTESEITSFKNTNNTLGGFGPLFSGVSLIAVASIVAIIAYGNGRKFGTGKVIFGIILAGVFISAIAMPISSYARYVPQLWAIPPIVAILLFMIKNNWVKILGTFLIMAIIWNIGLVAYGHFSFTIPVSMKLKSDLAQLRDDSLQKPITVSFGDFRSNRIRFSEAGIIYKEEKNLKCPQKRRILSEAISESIISICR